MKSSFDIGSHGMVRLAAMHIAKQSKTTAKADKFISDSNISMNRKARRKIEKKLKVKL